MAGVCTVCVAATLANPAAPHALPAVHTPAPLATYTEQYNLTAAADPLTILLTLASLPFQNGYQLLGATLNVPSVAISGTYSFGQSTFPAPFPTLPTITSPAGLNTAFASLFNGKAAQIPAALQNTLQGTIGALGYLLTTPAYVIAYDIQTIQNLFGTTSAAATSAAATSLAATSTAATTTADPVSNALTLLSLPFQNFYTLMNATLNVPSIAISGANATGFTTVPSGTPAGLNTAWADLFNGKSTQIPTVLQNTLTYAIAAIQTLIQTPANIIAQDIQTIAGIIGSSTSTAATTTAASITSLPSVTSLATAATSTAAAKPLAISAAAVKTSTASVTPATSTGSTDTATGTDTKSSSDTSKSDTTKSDTTKSDTTTGTGTKTGSDTKSTSDTKSADSTSTTGKSTSTSGDSSSTSGKHQAADGSSSTGSSSSNSSTGGSSSSSSTGGKHRASAGASSSGSSSSSHGSGSSGGHH
jgi:hypothetical protein